MRKLIFAVVGTISWVVVPVADASNRIFIGGSGTFPLVGYCAFPVQVNYTSNEYIIHQSTAPDGTITQKITGYAAYTVTNETSGKTITYKANGPGTQVIYPNGAFSLDLHGPNLLWTTPANSYPGVPFLSYTTGHVTVSVDATGMTTAYSLHGSRTDVCQALAG